MKLQLQKTTFTFLLLSVYFFKSFAQNNTKEISDSFFTIYSKDPAKAIEYAFSTNKWFNKRGMMLIN